MLLIILGRATPFHAGDRGSNPLGDAKRLQRVTLRSVTLFLLWGRDVGPGQGPNII
jgi:hypothetical protein